MEVFPKNHAVPFSKMLMLQVRRRSAWRASYNGEVPTQAHWRLEIGGRPAAEAGTRRSRSRSAHSNGNSHQQRQPHEKTEVEEEVPVRWRLSRPRRSGGEEGRQDGR